MSHRPLDHAASGTPIPAASQLVPSRTAVARLERRHRPLPTVPVVHAPDVPRAVAACRAVAGACGLRVDDAVVLNDSNRLAVHLRPCDVLARVAPRARQNTAAF